MPQPIKNEQFPEWGIITFGDMFEEIKQKTSDTEKYPLYSLTIENGVTEKTERYERSFLVTKNEDNYKIVPPNAFVYNPMNLRFGALAVNHTGKTVSVSQYYNVFKIKDESVLPFWENYLVMPSMLRFYFSIATGSLLEKLRVHYSDFVRVKKTLPSIEEQRKISEFLSLYDKRIVAQATKVEALETRRKGLLQQIFSQEIRFKDDDGSEFPKWDTEELNTYLYENKERNKENAFGKEDVLSVSKDYGVINQIKYQGRSLAGEDVSNYHIVHAGNVVYTKSPLGKQPYGIIKASETEGIVSTLYAVYYCRKNVLPKLLDYYFSLDETLNRYLKPLVNIGAKHDMKVNNTDALAGLVTLPSSLSEQQKIVDFFDLIGKQIQVEKDKLEAIKLVKKGLLQQMFV